MNQNRLQSPHHATVRMILRVGGLIIAATGLLLILIGLVSVFSAAGTFEPPRFFWCAFVGIPVLFVGLVMCQFGYADAIYRYWASVANPVARDSFNEMAEGIRPGLRTISKTIAEGVAEAQNKPGPKA